MFCFLVSCSSLEQNELPIEPLDSVLIHSQEHLLQSDSIQTKSDSVTKDYVVKVVKEIQFLNKEVEKFKTERFLLEKNLTLVSQKVITRVDTVFIEVEKNFWGKKKTKTTVSSDSSISELTDSSSISNQIIDTISYKPII
jgi:hypothetical protein